MTRPYIYLLSTRYCVSQLSPFRLHFVQCCLCVCSPLTRRIRGTSERVSSAKSVQNATLSPTLRAMLLMFNWTALVGTRHRRVRSQLELPPPIALSPLAPRCLRREGGVCGQRLRFLGELCVLAVRMIFSSCLCGSTIFSLLRRLLQFQPRRSNFLPQFAALLQKKVNCRRRRRNKLY